MKKRDRLKAISYMEACLYCFVNLWDMLRQTETDIEQEWPTEMQDRFFMLNAEMEKFLLELKQVHENAD